MARPSREERVRQHAAAVAHVESRFTPAQLAAMRCAFQKSITEDLNQPCYGPRRIEIHRRLVLDELAKPDDDWVDDGVAAMCAAMRDCDPERERQQRQRMREN
jgi:hypothetical protein